MPRPVILEAADRHTVAVAFSPDGSRLAVGAQEGHFQLYDTETWSLVRQLEGHGASVNGIAWHPDGNELLTWASDKTVRRWSLDTGSPEWSRFGYILAAPDPNWNEFLAVKDTHSHADILTPGSGQVRDALVNGIGKITDVWHLKKHNRWACNVDPHDVHVFQRNGDKVGKMTGHTWRCTDLAQNADGSTIVTADDDGNLTRWDPDTLDAAQQIDPRRDIGHRTRVALDPDGHMLAAAGPGGVNVLDLKGRVLTSWKVDLQGVYQVAVHPDRTHVANAAADGKVRVWKVPPSALKALG